MSTPLIASVPSVIPERHPLQNKLVQNFLLCKLIRDIIYCTVYPGLALRSHDCIIFVFKKYLLCLPSFS